MGNGARQRIEFIDLAKGFCIILVVVRHIMISCGCNVDLPGLDNMRMPLYFVLSGLFFKDYGGFIQLLVKKLNKLLIPFLFFYIGSYLIFYISECVAPGLLKTRANGILDAFTQRYWFNGPIWFLLGLFWANIMFCVVSLNFKKEIARAVIVVCIGCVGAGLGVCGKFLPCYFDSAMTSMPFFYMGYFLRKTPLLNANKYDRYNLLFAVALYGVSVAIFYLFDNPHVGFSLNAVHGNWVAIIVSAISGVLAVLLICKTIGRLPFVSYLGRYSIITLCTHHLVYRPVKVVLTHFNISGGVLLTVLTILTILICWALIPLCIRCIPYFTAQKDLIKVPVLSRKKSNN